MESPQVSGDAPAPPKAPLPASAKVLGWLALILGAGQFAMGMPVILAPGGKGSLLAVPGIYIANVVCTALGGVIAFYALGLLRRREWGRRGMVALLYATAAMAVAALALLHLADFSRLKDLDAVRRLDAAGSLDQAGPEFWALLKRVTVVMTAVFAALIVLFHALIARYLGTAPVRAACGQHAPATSEPPPIPVESPR